MVSFAELARMSFGTEVLFFSEIVNCVHSIRGDCNIYEIMKGVIRPDLFASKTPILQLKLARKSSYLQWFRKAYISAFQASFLCEAFVFRIVKFQYIIKSAAWHCAVFVDR